MGIRSTGTLRGSTGMLAVACNIVRMSSMSGFVIQRLHRNGSEINSLQAYTKGAYLELYVMIIPPLAELVHAIQSSMLCDLM